MRVRAGRCARGLANVRIGSADVPVGAGGRVRGAGERAREDWRVCARGLAGERVVLARGVGGRARGIGGRTGAAEKRAQMGWRTGVWGRRGVRLASMRGDLADGCVRWASARVMLAHHEGGSAREAGEHARRAGGRAHGAGEHARWADGRVRATGERVREAGRTGLTSGRMGLADQRVTAGGRARGGRRACAWGLASGRVVRLASVNVRLAVVRVRLTSVRVGMEDA